MKSVHVDVMFSHTNSVNTVTSPAYFFHRKWPISAICVVLGRSCMQSSVGKVSSVSLQTCEVSITGLVCQVFLLYAVITKLGSFP